MRAKELFGVGIAWLGMMVVASGVAGQSSFPIRFADEALSAATNVASAAAVAVETGRNYSKAFTWEASPAGSSVNVLDVIATTDDTTVVIRVLVASSLSDGLVRRDA